MLAYCGTLRLRLQVRGKGYRPSEGIEQLVGLPPLAAEWARQPHNYDRLQAVLDAVPTGPDTLIMDTANLHNGSFSGGDPLLLAAVKQCRSRRACKRTGSKPALLLPSLPSAMPLQNRAAFAAVATISGFWFLISWRCSSLVMCRLLLRCRPRHRAGSTQR